MRASKTRKQFVIPWTEQLRRIVQWVKANNKRQGATLFCDRYGKPYSKDSFHTRWQWGMRKAIKEGGLRERFTEHDLRAKHATDAERQASTSQPTCSIVTSAQQRSTYSRSRFSRLPRWSWKTTISYNPRSRIARPYSRERGIYNAFPL